jgi:hypothetical protein
MVRDFKLVHPKTGDKQIVIEATTLLYDNHPVIRIDYDDVDSVEMLELAERIIDFLQKETVNTPTIVCLCGSTRFSEAFRDANLEETLNGKIVLSVGCDFKSDQALGLTVADKKSLDELHLRKIDLADEVLILNVNGYIGDSTWNELRYAKTKGKRIRFLDFEKRPAWETI